MRKRFAADATLRNRCVSDTSRVDNSNIRSGGHVVVIGPGPSVGMHQNGADLRRERDHRCRAHGDEQRLQMALTYGATAAVNSQEPGALKKSWR